MIAGAPYETVGFKIPSKKVDFSEGVHFEEWDSDQRKYKLRIGFL